jgi:hypothetical protein
MYAWSREWAAFGPQTDNPSATGSHGSPGGYVMIADGWVLTGVRWVGFYFFSAGSDWAVEDVWAFPLPRL